MGDGVTNGRLDVFERLDGRLRVDAPRARREIDLDKAIPAENGSGCAFAVQRDDERM